VKAKIISKRKYSVWYNNHIGEMIDVIISNKIELFDINEVYEVIGPKELLDYYERECGYQHLGIDIIDVDTKLRKEKYKKILKK
jgi:hypothetical protein